MCHIKMLSCREVEIQNMWPVSGGGGETEWIACCGWIALLSKSQWSATPKMTITSFNEAYEGLLKFMKAC